MCETVRTGRSSVARLLAGGAGVALLVPTLAACSGQVRFDTDPPGSPSVAATDGTAAGSGKARGGSVGGGGGKTGGGSEGTPAGGDLGGHDGVDPGWPDVEPSPEDCIPYNPSNLTVHDIGADGWQMRDGGHAMALFDTQADAEDGVKVARNHTQSCFIGRDNHRPNRDRYIVRYWKGSSGLPLGPAPALDCVGYDPADVHVESAGADGWRVVSEDKWLVLLDTQADAERAKHVAASVLNLCFIGRDNTRPNRFRYILEYWRT
jgi:hypothetical protein